MRNVLLIFACLFCLCAGLNAQILSPLPYGKIDLIVLFPPGTNEANIARCRTELGATEESISFPSGTRVWRMANVVNISGVSYSFIGDPTDAVGRVQGRTDGVGVGGVSYVQINTVTQAPAHSFKNQPAARLAARPGRGRGQSTPRIRRPGPPRRTPSCPAPQ